MGANDGNETREAEGVGAIVVGVSVWLVDGVGADEEEVDIDEGLAVVAFVGWLVGDNDGNETRDAEGVGALVVGSLVGFLLLNDFVGITVGVKIVGSFVGAKDGNETKDADGVGAIVVGITLVNEVGASEEVVDGLLEGLREILLGR